MIYDMSCTSETTRWRSLDNCWGRGSPTEFPGPTRPRWSSWSFRCRWRPSSSPRPWTWGGGSCHSQIHSCFLLVHLNSAPTLFLILTRGVVLSLPHFICRRFLFSDFPPVFGGFSFKNTWWCHFLWNLRILQMSLRRKISFKLLKIYLLFSNC